MLLLPTCLLASEPLAERAGKARYQVRIALRDGTTIFGELTGIANGQIVVETHHGKLTIAGERVRNITPVESFPARLGRWLPRPVAPMEKERLLAELGHIEGEFVGAFRSPTAPPPRKALQMMWRLSTMALMLQEYGLPLQVISKARESNALNRTGRRSDTLTGCEAIAHGAMGDMAKSRDIADSLSGEVKKLLMEVVAERSLRRGALRGGLGGGRGRGFPKKP